MPRSIGIFSLNIFGDLWGEKLAPVLVWMQDRYPSLYVCRNQVNIESDRNLLGIIGNLLEELWAFLWNNELIKCLIISHLFITRSTCLPLRTGYAQWEEPDYCKVQQHWGERTISSKDNPKENLLEVEWNWLETRQISPCRIIHKRINPSGQVGQSTTQL